MFQESQELDHASIGSKLILSFFLCAGDGAGVNTTSPGLFKSDTDSKMSVFVLSQIHVSSRRAALCTVSSPSLSPSPYSATDRCDGSR